MPPPAFVPANPQSVLAPFGTELFIWTGIQSTIAGTDELSIGTAANPWIPSGLYVITTSTVDDTVEDMVITLDLSDRGWTIAQRTLKQPYNFPATPGGYFENEIVALLNMVWSQQQGVKPLQYNIVPTSAIVPPASYDQGSDPWQAAVDIATSIGYELFFDAYGVVTAIPIPNPLTQPPVWSFTDDPTLITGLSGTGSGALLGDAYSTPVEESISMTRDGIYNDIVIQGTGYNNAGTYTGTQYTYVPGQGIVGTGGGLETSGPPILAEAADGNPQSPTWVGGGLGDVPNFISTALIAAGFGAQGMADADLQVALSSSWLATISAAPNPILDVDDVIQVTRPRVGLNNATVILDTITHVINYADQMMLTGRVLTNGSYEQASDDIIPPPPVPVPGVRLGALANVPFGSGTFG